MPDCGDHFYRPGHNLHSIQAEKAGSDPLAWFPATVIGIDGEIATVRYDDDDRTCRLWRHGGYAARLWTGDRVSVCERWGVLQPPATARAAWVCVDALDAAEKRTTGLPEDRPQPFRAVPVDMATGEGHP